MSTEKLPFKLPLKAADTCDLIDSDGVYIVMVRGDNRPHRDANRATILHMLNTWPQLVDALKGYAQCSDGCTCGDGWSHEPAIEALKLLNPKAEG